MLAVQGMDRGCIRLQAPPLLTLFRSSRGRVPWRGRFQALVGAESGYRPRRCSLLLRAPGVESLAGASILLGLGAGLGAATSQACAHSPAGLLGPLLGPILGAAPGSRKIGGFRRVFGVSGVSGGFGAPARFQAIFGLFLAVFCVFWRVPGEFRRVSASLDGLPRASGERL